MFKEIDLIKEFKDMSKFLAQVVHLKKDNTVLTNSALFETLYIFIKKHTKAHLYQSALYDNYYFALERLSQLNKDFEKEKDNPEYFKNGVSLDCEHRIFSSIVSTFEDQELQQKRHQIIEQVYEMMLLRFEDKLTYFDEDNICVKDKHENPDFYVTYDGINQKIAEAKWSFEISVNAFANKYKNEGIFEQKTLIKAIYLHLVMLVELEHANIIEKDLRCLIRNADLLRGKTGALLHYQDYELSDFFKTHFCLFAMRAYHPSGIRSDKFNKIYMFYLRDSESIAEFAEMP